MEIIHKFCSSYFAKVLFKQLPICTAVYTENKARWIFQGMQCHFFCLTHYAWVHNKQMQKRTIIVDWKGTEVVYKIRSQLILIVLLRSNTMHNSSLFQYFYRSTYGPYSSWKFVYLYVYTLLQPDMFHSH